MRSVTGRAGMSPGALYNSFANLHDLLRSLWTGSVDRAGEQLAFVAAAHEDPVERIRAILEAYVDYVRSNPELHRNLLLFVRPINLPEPEVRQLEELPLFVHLRDAIAEGIAAGSIREGDPAQGAQVLWAGVHGALGLPINVEGFALDEPDALAAAMIDTLIAALRP